MSVNTEKNVGDTWDTVKGTATEQRRYKMENNIGVLLYENI